MRKAAKVFGGRRKASTHFGVLYVRVRGTEMGLRNRGIRFWDEVVGKE